MLSPPKNLTTWKTALKLPVNPQGGGAEIAYVTITYNYATNTTTCDKTWEELVEYMIAGKLIIGKLIVGSTNLTMFISRGGSGFTGCCIDPNSSNSETLNHYIFKLTKNGDEEVARVYVVSITGYMLSS